MHFKQKRKEYLCILSIQLSIAKSMKTTVFISGITIKSPTVLLVATIKPRLSRKLSYQNTKKSPLHQKVFGKLLYQFS